jgi:hypothetical protein
MEKFTWEDILTGERFSIESDHDAIQVNQVEDSPEFQRWSIGRIINRV